MAGVALLPSRRVLRWLDLLAVATVLAFAGLGAVAGLHLANLGQLGTGLADVARSLDMAARAVALLAEAPLVGDPADRLSASVAEAARSVGANAEDVRGSVSVLSVVVGVAIGVLPLPLLLGCYLPLRLARSREVRGLRRLVRGPVDPLLVEHLAHGAVARIPYAELRRVSPAPWRDLDAGRHRHLAAAELARLGVAPPPGWRDTDPPTLP